MLLELRDIETYYGVSYILQGVSLNVREKEIVCLLGRNGVGKTTTLKTITGLIHPKSGHVKFSGSEITPYPPHKISRLGISYVPQEKPVFPNLSVKENLELVSVSIGAGKPRGGIERVSGYFPVLRERERQLASLLSGGEQRILGLARVLMVDSKLLLLDEPLTGLSPVVANQFVKILTKLSEETGVSILLVEQHATLALTLASRCYVMSKGRIAFEGTSEEARGSDEVRKLLGVYA